LLFYDEFSWTTFKRKELLKLNGWFRKPLVQCLLKLTVLHSVTCTLKDKFTAIKPGASNVDFGLKLRYNFPTYVCNFTNFPEEYTSGPA
jgi:hypothetical protein